jgi:hypothetical protein
LARRWLFIFFLLLLASTQKPTDGFHFLIWLLAAAGRKSVNGFFPFSTEF